MPDAGETFGRYIIGGLLGAGSFGSVYRATDTVLGREVALKLLLPHVALDPENAQRFLNEAQALAALHHPNIVTVYDLGSEQGQPYFTMELVEGETLAQRLRRRGALPLADALALLDGLAAAVDHLHAAGIVHRDLKPANVMIAGDGTVKLMDFGVARALDRPQLTQTGYSLGTLAYAAPEQVRGLRVDRQADIYALGVIAYEMIAGRPPFGGETAYIVYATAHEPPPPLRQIAPGLPGRVYAAIETALAKEPDQRPASAGALLRAMTGAEPLPASARMRSAPARPTPPTQHRTARLATPAATPAPELVRYRFAVCYVPSFLNNIAGQIALTDRRLLFEPESAEHAYARCEIALTEITTLGRGRRGVGPRSSLVVHTSDQRSFKFTHFRDGHDANAVIAAIQSLC